MDPMESAWRLLKRQTTLTGDFGFPENPRNRYRGEYLGPIHVPTESLEFPTMETVYEDSIDPDDFTRRPDFGYTYGNTVRDILNIGEANAQADFDPNSMLWEAGRESPPNVRFTTQMKLPQLIPGLTTERWLDPQTNTVIPGSIPPINAYRFTGDIASRVMTTPGGQLIPMSGRSYVGSYEENVSNPLPYRYNTEEGMPMQFLVPPNVKEMNEVLSEKKENLFGVRGLGFYPGDLVQERPRFKGGESAEYVAMTPIDNSRLTPLRASGSWKSDTPNATNWRIKSEDTDWMTYERMQPTAIEERLRRLNPLDRRDYPYKTIVTPQQAAWREYASQFPMSAIHPALEGAYDKEGFPLQPGGREMTTEEKLELIDAMRRQVDDKSVKEITSNIEFIPGQLASKAIYSNTPLGIMRHGSFPQGLDKLSPKMIESALAAYKNLRTY